MPRPTFRLFVLLLLTCLALGLGACRREVVAPGDPVAAVKGLAEAIQDNDLVRYSRLSVPPALHKQMEERWHAKLAVAPPPTEKERAEFARWMGRLTEPGAEGKLYQSLDPKLKKLEAEIGSQWPLMQTTAGIFIKGVINANPKLTDSEKAHASEVGGAVMAWLQPQVLTDRARARQAMVVLSATARELDLHTLEQTRQLEMIPALEKGGVLLKGLKDMGRVYGIDGDAALAGVSAKTIAADGDFATMQVTYPLLGKTVSFEMQLIRRDGRWYSADAVRSAEAELSQPLSTAVR
ncbi:hypothetical protein [Arenimonas oryziterrae]|uniref:Uncharacterized protein n=1 Tax=Arenimonas oryziterrae DSM 21050 = YC6267 TaxID=1121015 RepID=A0A091AWM0_9GAMM|nr:hypothetical protein [Arenimonas oryziterrae]KFN43826.1 hypothetical protein N789_07725 [Arenimonas oryziterrae DSM 21050 = YC6267]